LENGGTTADWEAKGKAEWKAGKETKNGALKNKLGQEIVFNEKMLQLDRYKDAIETIKELASEYDTRLQKVSMGAKNAAGSVDISCSEMKLSSVFKDIVIHEFAHTLSNVKGTKYGVMDDTDFWNEIRKIRTRYRKAVSENSNASISSYADIGGGSSQGDNLDEFMAEAFTQAIAARKGLKLRDKYGNDLTYSNQVLEVIDKYFKKKK
jgi:hypothetical protein